MGYAWHGVCYQDSASALEAFAADVPSADAAGIISFDAQPVIGGDTITWSIRHRPLTGDTITTRTGTTVLQPCNEGVDQWPVQSIILPAVLFICAFMGFSAGYRS